MKNKFKTAIWWILGIVILSVVAFLLIASLLPYLIFGGFLIMALIGMYIGYQIHKKLNELNNKPK